jgi:hypothetical protein
MVPPVVRAGSPATPVRQPRSLFSAQGNTALVHVPARPQPRSPFMPPSPWGR